MISREAIKQKYEKFHSNFNFRDFVGLSSLIFGLVLSNSAIDKSNANAIEQQPTHQTEREEVQNLKKKSKKPSRKRKLSKKGSKKKNLRNLNKQTVTAAHKTKPE